MPALRSATCGITIAAMGVADFSAKGAEAPVLPLPDCGTTRYSAESMVDALATNVTQPESDAGSIDVYAAGARLSCEV